jgi:hypothetical protein
MLDQGCPIEFFRKQRSPFYFLAHIKFSVESYDPDPIATPNTNKFLSVRGVKMFLYALYYFI